MNVLELMKQKERFTKAEFAVINYMQEHLSSLKNLSIQELADKSFTSNATIIRCCHKLGFEGYRDFKIGVLSELVSEKYMTHEVDYSMPFQKDESVNEVINSIYSIYKDGIDIIQSQLDVAELEEIANQMIKADRIFIFAIGDTQITAMGFVNKMLKINYFPILATDKREEPAIIEHMTKSDCALFLTYSGTRPEYTEYFRKLMKKQVPTIVLTANENTLLAKYASHILYIPDMERDEKIATFYSQLGFTYYLNLIYSLIYHLERT